MLERVLKKQLHFSLKNGKSVLILGPRQTGKSTLSQAMMPIVEFNLSDQETFMRFARDADYLKSFLLGNDIHSGTIFVDEVQRVPSLLNTVQYLIDSNKKLHFILTGSSARKLKRGRANLLPGRLHVFHLGPLTLSELGYPTTVSEIERFVTFGTLPEIALKKKESLNKRTLKSYATTYLAEEIKAEALTKSIEGFTRFLFQLAAESGKFLDLSKISSLSGVPRQSVQRFFEILEDTLIVTRCPAFSKSEKTRLVQHPKVYFFDNGVLNGLLSNFTLSDDRKGMLFENFVFTQLSNGLSYSTRDYRLSSYRTSSGAEVDIILEIDGQFHAIEAKAGKYSEKELSGFKSFEGFVGKKVKKFLLLPTGPKLLKNDILRCSISDYLKLLKI